jgi:hypothetical protein
VRKQWQQRPGIYRFAPASWQEGHPSQLIQETPAMDLESPKATDACAQLRSKSWARLLQKVYDVDPFICPKCQGIMTVVAIIEDPKELAKIIDWAGREQSSLLARATGAKKQEQETQVIGGARSPPELILATV